MGQDAAVPGRQAAPTVGAERRVGLASAWTRGRDAGSRHPGWWLVAAAVVTAVLWFSHMPSLLLHAQFYADDGSWYQRAYSQGPLSSLPHPAAGYFVTLQRLAASASLALPTVAVPTFFNLVALAVEVGGICYLLSSRMASVIPSVAVRVAIAVAVIALPNAYDTSGNLTNTQWHLGLFAFLVVFASPARRAAGWILDAVIIVVGGLTGPYCILLEPIIGWLWLRRRNDRRLGYLLVANSLCSAAQLLVILTRFGAQRSSVPLGAGFFSLVRLIGRQLTLGLVAGAHGLTHIVGSPLADSAAVLAVLAAIPLVVCAWAVWRGPVILRAFCLFAGAELALALAAPSIAGTPWLSLGNPANITEFHPGGIRYFLYPLLAFAISLGWLAARWRARPGRIRRAAGLGAGAVLLATLAIGVPADWTYPPYIDQHWGAEVQRLEAAPPGTVVVLPINPRGWTVALVARRQ